MRWRAQSRAPPAASACSAVDTDRLAPFVGAGPRALRDARRRPIPTSARRSSDRRPRSTRSTTSTQAIAAANDSDYGLAASVMTRDRAVYEHCVGRIARGRAQLEPRHDRRERPAPVRRQRQERQRPARWHHRDALLHRAAVAPRVARRASIRRRCRPGAPSRSRCSYRRTVLMGDPTHFSVKGGANPHTRTRWGTRRAVDRAAAIAAVARACTTCSRPRRARARRAAGRRAARASSIPPTPASSPTSTRRSRSPRRRFHLANLLPTRAGEKRALPARARSGRLPLRGRSIRATASRARPTSSRPATATCSRTAASSTSASCPRSRIPPWKRVYGFRTDARVEPVLAALVQPRRVLRVELVLEAHYHGDTALCAFGPGASTCSPTRAALAPGGWRAPRGRFADALVELSDDDAARYAANSFTLTPGRRLAPGHAGRRLRAAPGAGARARRDAPSWSTSPSS